MISLCNSHPTQFLFFQSCGPLKAETGAAALCETGGKHMNLLKMDAGAAVSTLLFGFKYAASVCLSGSTLMWLLHKHSLLKVPVIRLMQRVSMGLAAAGMWMFSQ